MTAAPPRGPGPDTAAAATNRHYDLPPELFAAFLGSHQKYSCALFGEGTETLDDAQSAKLRHIAELLELRGGERVADIGAGWGSVTIFLAQQYGCRVTAVTPSPVQRDHILARAAAADVADRVEAVNAPFHAADLGARRFDAVTMEEVVEHLPDQRAALRKAYGLLRQGGRLYVSASCYRNRAAMAEYAARPASAHAVELFGHTAMAPVSDLLTHVEAARFSISSLTDLTAHYEPTMRRWLEAISHRRDDMERTAPGMAAELERYFQAAMSSWGYTGKVYAIGAIRSRMGRTRPATPR